ncbi:MAG: hypothetical protein KF871_07900 [Hydrogenophaga sp.]|uniref:hypothetical protein n=1 Tax=Hydrogenophaga sp. TaxID=1904254 RepID=UPI001DE61ADF|nr:hypothetical protein [Hydrogenophaga sp.]MBX3609807.1 hypothetical protein [Hydrogenophaga sp.]
MSWRPLPKGRFTGIDWSAPGAIDGMDPYLAWAEADGFVGYHAPGRRDQPHWLPIVIGLREGADVRQLVDASSTQWLQVPTVYLLTPGLRHCTARVSRDFFKAWRRHHPVRALIERFELGLPVEHHARALAHFCHPHKQPRPVRDRLHGPVLGVIDGGLALANAAFRDGRGRTRILRFWRQDNFYGGVWPGPINDARVPLDPHRAGPMPHDMGYGHELHATQIDRDIARFTQRGHLNEEALYRHLQLPDLSHPVNHGTHVTGLATAPGGLLDAARNDFASRCPIVAVQLDWANVLDTSGGAMNVSVLDGLHYIVSRCTDDAAIVTNISWGTLAGPHDGTSLLEAAMDELVQVLGGRLQITVPAGNAYQSRTHANATLARRTSLDLHWTTLPDDQTQSFLEIWLPANAQQVNIGISPPDRPDQAVTLAPGASGMWVGGDGRPRWSAIYPHTSALGSLGTCALIALEPSFHREAGHALAPFGRWTVSLHNHGTQPVTFDAYVERDDVALGVNTGAKQSFFEDRSYDTLGNLNGWVDHASNPTPIRRSGTFNSLSTGQATVSVGGTRATDDGPQALARFARYSPQRPDPDPTRPQRPGVKLVPETLAPSDDNPALWGVRSTGTLSASSARLAGTSSSAPQEARRRLNALE